MAERDNHFDSSRAELFEALGHPTRVRILRALGAKTMGFSELKRKAGIESSGHLQFHLGKLLDLVATNSEGSYALTDEGREAIRVLESTTTGLEGTRSGPGGPFRKRVDWARPVIAGLLIAVIILGGVGVYQQQQIAALDHALYADTVEIGGARYYYESVPTSMFNGSAIVFHGVTFTSLQAPSFCYSNPANSTFACSVRLSNGTLLDLAGKTVVLEMNGFLAPRLSSDNAAFGGPYYAVVLNTGMAITFPDGSHETYNGFNITARFQHAYNLIVAPVVVLTYTYQPSSTNPWFGHHMDPQAGVFWNYTGNPSTLNLYVSAPG